MQKEDLKIKKQKLTIFFVVIVFFLAFFLEIIFVSYKYFSEKKVDKQIFIKQTQKIYKKINNQKNILDLFEDSFFEDNLKNLKHHNISKINFLLLDENNNIIDKKVFEDIDYHNFINLKLNKIMFKTDFFILEKKLQNNILADKIIFYKKINFDEITVLQDFIKFLIIIFFSVLVFYFLWKKFVNKTLKPVEENISDMKNFIHNVSHEFKTPIAVINSNLQLIKAEKKYDKNLIEENIKIIKDFNNLIDSLNQLSWISLDLKKEKVKLKKEIPEIIAENIEKIKIKNIKINFEIKNNWKIIANKSHFKILFQNLLQNAIKYNKKWWKIDIILDKKILIIKDNWIWIKKENLWKIFDRFYRENNSDIWEWFGIWLSLVLKIIKLNNWKINIESQKNIWTTIKIKF